MYNSLRVDAIMEGFLLGRSLKDEIEFTREAMVNAAMKEGLSAKETLALSQKLDGLINRFTIEQESQCCLINMNTVISKRIQ